MGITNFIAKRLVNYDSDKSPAFKLRKIRAERIKILINECYNKYGEVRIIDIGGTRTYWNIFSLNYLAEKKVQISVVNLPSEIPLPSNDHIFTYYHGDACNLVEFKDKSFHIAHSNSVIEHVGADANRIKFAQEIKRVSNTYYIQTPNYWFPLEPHFMTPFFQFLPEKIRIKMVQNFALGWFERSKDYKEAKAIVDSCNLLTQQDLQTLFPEADLYKEKIGFIIKSFVMIKNCIV